MKKIVTLLFLLSCTTFASAQLLHRTEKIKSDQWKRTDQILINLDTMPDIQFAFIKYGNRWGSGKRFTFNIGDGYKWQLVDAASKPIEADNPVEAFNLMYKYNWVFQTAISQVIVVEGGGGNRNDFVFKRK